MRCHLSYAHSTARSKKLVRNRITVSSAPSITVAVRATDGPERLRRIYWAATPKPTGSARFFLRPTYPTEEEVRSSHSLPASDVKLISEGTRPSLTLIHRSDWQTLLLCMLLW